MGVQEASFWQRARSMYAGSWAKQTGAQKHVEILVSKQVKQNTVLCPICTLEEAVQGHHWGRDFILGWGCLWHRGWSPRWGQCHLRQWRFQCCPWVSWGRLGCGMGSFQVDTCSNCWESKRLLCLVETMAYLEALGLWIINQWKHLEQEY